jgi:pyruvate/2-oxoglutarate dehydrogenase complex dihydrolipoamide dehydrogenase (E3) component
VQDAPELLRADDPDVGRAVRAALARDGVTVLLDAEVRAAKRDADAALLDVRTPAGSHEVHCDFVLIATNRHPRIAALDLAAANIDGDEAHGISVDATLRSVSNPRVYAAGDVLGRRALVHSAVYAGRLAASNAFAAQPAEAQWDRWESHAVYTQPQVAIAGLTERTCRERGLDIRVVTLPAGEVGKALVSEQTDGFVKMIALRDGRIVGITLVLDDAIDLVGEAIALIDRGATATEIAEMPHLHPTMSELIARAAERLV